MKCLFLIITVISIYSCNVTEPQKENFIPGRRDYLWSLDTLDIDITRGEYMTFRDMVGNSPDDIWLGNLEPGLWHYNGIEWRNVPFPGVIPSALWLFKDNTLWVGTGENKILKRENDHWLESFELDLAGYDWINIYGIWGKSKNDIYAVGMAVNVIKLGYDYEYKGIILHYNGTDWKYIDITKFDGGFHKIVYQENIDLFFIYGLRSGNINQDVILTFDGKNTKEIMSTNDGIGLSKINGIVYINASLGKVYKYSKSGLVLWKDFTGTGFLTNFVGRSETDFINNSNKGIGHYNGIDYKTIYKTNLDLQSSIIFEKDIFIAAEDFNGNHIIIRGKLKE